MISIQQASMHDMAVHFLNLNIYFYQPQCVVAGKVCHNWSKR